MSKFLRFIVGMLCFAGLVGAASAKGVNETESAASMPPTGPGERLAAYLAPDATSFPVPGVGSATLRFTNGKTGTFSYTLDGVSQTKAIQRFVVVGEEQPKSLCAE